MKNGIIVTVVLAIWGLLKAFAKLLKRIIQVLTGLIIFLGLYIPLFYVLFGVILLVTTDFAFGGTGTDQILYYIGLGLCCIASLIIAIRNAIVRPISQVFAPLTEYREEMRQSREGRRGRHYEEDEEDYDPDEEDARDFRPRRREDRRREEAYYDEDDRREEYSRYPSPRDDRAYRGYAEDREYPPYYREREDRPAYRPPIEERPRYEERDRRYDRYEEPERPLIYYSKRRPGVLVKEYSDRFELFEEDAHGRTYIGTEYKDE